MTALINHFFNAVMLKGMEIVPSDMETDKEVSDEEFLNRAMFRGSLRGGPVYIPVKRNESERTPKSKIKKTAGQQGRRQEQTTSSLLLR